MWTICDLIADDIQGSFRVWAQPMRDDFALKRRPSLADPIPRTIPGYFHNISEVSMIISNSLWILSSGVGKQQIRRNAANSLEGIGALCVTAHCLFLWRKNVSCMKNIIGTWHERHGVFLELAGFSYLVINSFQTTHSHSLSLSLSLALTHSHTLSHTHTLCLSVCLSVSLSIFISIYCPACRTTLVATRFRVAVICPIIQVPPCIRVFFYFLWFVFINRISQFYNELCTYCNILDIYLS